MPQKVKLAECTMGTTAPWRLLVLMAHRGGGLQFKQCGGDLARKQATECVVCTRSGSPFLALCREVVESLSFGVWLMEEVGCWNLAYSLILPVDI